VLRFLGLSVDSSSELILRKFIFLFWLRGWGSPAVLTALEILLFIKKKECFFLIGSMEFWQVLDCGRRRQRFCSWG